MQRQQAQCRAHAEEAREYRRDDEHEAQQPYRRAEVLTRQGVARNPGDRNDDYCYGRNDLRLDCRLADYQRAGGLTLGVPANLVEVVRRSPVAQVDAAYASQWFAEGSESLPFYWTGALMQSAPRSTEVAGKTRPVIILRSAS